MTRENRNWNSEFLKYMEIIINHPNYKGLRIDKKKDGSYKWIATAKSEVGKERIEWCLKKAKELNIPIKEGVYADVMLEIHPTKKKVCQICGKSMDLYYYYPSVVFAKSLNKHFNSNFTENDNINEIWDCLVDNGIKKTEIAKFLVEKGDLDLNWKIETKEKIIAALEFACRKKGKKCLGPGAMSNFPDRFDGFHSYNKCCRSKQDKGRFKENLKTYTKDRRAYEYWSDGNIHAADEFMGSTFFRNASADHIGPISLGFVHDPKYLQKMTSSDNSTKRDRLSVNDVEKIIKIEKTSDVYAMSWYSKIIWEYIKLHYKSEPDKVSSLYRDMLKQNMTNFMYVLYYILEKCSHKGKDILIKSFLNKHFDSFLYSYKFDKNGNVISKNKRHFTDRNRNEITRYKRVAIESIYEYNKKANRNKTKNLSENELKYLKNICENINEGVTYEEIKLEIENLMQVIQNRLIANLKKCI